MEVLKQIRSLVKQIYTTDDSLLKNKLLAEILLIVETQIYNIDNDPFREDI